MQRWRPGLKQSAYIKHVVFIAWIQGYPSALMSAHAEWRILGIQAMQTASLCLNEINNWFHHEVDKAPKVLKNRAEKTIATFDNVH